MAQLIPYLSFDKNCREAMLFYQTYLGGELHFQMVRESPEMAAQMPAAMSDLILHASLISGPIILMGSDLNRAQFLEGNTIHLCIQCNTEEEINTFFARLAHGGSVVEAITDMPWGAKFASVTDKYGKHWVFNWDKE